MGRTATGVRGIRLAAGEAEAGDTDGEGDEQPANTGGAKVVSLIVIDGDGDILTASERGYGKRTPVAEYPRKGRGTQGVIALKTTERNGCLVGAVQLSDHHEVLLISDGGTLVRTRAAEISQVSRNTQGVTLMRLAADESLQAIERLDASLDDDSEAEAGVAGAVAPAVTDELPAGSAD
jgi:DNA gyrase subunit A